MPHILTKLTNPLRHILKRKVSVKKSNVMIALTRQTSEANNLQNWEKLREH